MLFKDYVAGLNQLLKLRPELADATAVYASDDEGNSFHEVHSNGTIWERDEHYKEFQDETETPNAVCIN